MQKEKVANFQKKPFEEFTLFSDIREDENLKNHFIKMQKIYVFDEKDMFEYEKMVKSMVELNEVLLTLDEGLVFEEKDLQMNMN